MQIDAPRQQFLSTREAARWIGISEDLFTKLARLETWMRPVYFGEGKRRLKRWARMDVVCFAWIYQRRTANQKSEENSGDADGRG